MDLHLQYIVFNLKPFKRQIIIMIQNPNTIHVNNILFVNIIFCKKKYFLLFSNSVNICTLCRFPVYKIYSSGGS